MQVDPVALYAAAAILKACDGRDVGEELREALAVGIALSDEHIALLRSNILGCGHRLEVALDGCHGGLELVVDIVCQLALDA